MKPNLPVVAVLILVSAAARAADSAPSTTDLTVVASGLESAQGEVRVALYDSRDGYEGKQPPFRTALTKSATGQVQVVFRDVPPGDYAIALYHDRNGNGKLDRGLFGKPVEPYGFSNNVRGTMGAPDFDQARFTLPAAGATLDIKVR